MSYKQAIILDTDLGMSKGKMIAQACHASLKAYENASKKQQKKWKNNGQKKVILAKGENQLHELTRQAKRNKLPKSLIKDAGHTELQPGAKTAAGIGPAKEKKIDKITGQLRLIN